MIPSLSLNSLHLGSDFHVFRRLLPFRRDRLSGRGGMPSARWPIPYMPGGHFLEESVRRGTPRVICTTHIVDHRWCAAGERVVLSGLCQASCMAVRRVQRSVSYCSTVVAPLLPNSPEGMGGRLAEVFPLIGSFLCVDLRVHLDLWRRRLQLPHLGKLSHAGEIALPEAMFHQITPWSIVWMASCHAKS